MLLELQTAFEATKAEMKKRVEAVSRSPKEHAQMIRQVHARLANVTGNTTVSNGKCTVLLDKWHFVEFEVPIP